VAPYEWLETGTGNGLTEVGTGSFVRSSADHYLITDASEDRNYHFTGPNTEQLSDYTIRGSFKFDSTDAEFGINFYSQWPDSAKKYVLMRESDGLARLYYYSGAASRTQLGSALDTCDTAGCAGNDAPIDAAIWYSYSIKIEPTGGQERIQVKIWVDSLDEPATPGIDASNAQTLNGGLVGVTSHSGSSVRYWGPMTVTSNRQPAGAYMAYETFHKEDSLVDVSPFTPVSWHPDYGFGEFVSGPDSTGFVLDTADSGSLVYRHKPGVKYPVTCRLIPETNLEWRDYEFKDTIIVPDDAAYDTVQFGLVFYHSGKENTYKVTFRDSLAYFEGGGIGETQANGFIYHSGDTITSTAIARTLLDAQGQQTETEVEVWLGVNSATENRYINLRDTDSASFLTEGYAGVWVDLSDVTSPESVSPLSIRRASIRKE
jgi:hypothetical protein